MSSVSLKGIYKKYAGGVVAVSDFNLEIDDKEFIILVGPSGCGKSTTLRMIAGLEEITQGELYIDNRLVNDVPPKERDIAMVFQNYALYPHMTVFENMSFGLRIRKMPKDEIRRRVDEAAKILEIGHLLDRKPAALSGGQRQRVALGRAIVRNPKVFLLDEPLSNLDAKLRTAMRSELIKLHHKLATTFIYVTHDQTEAMTMGTRIVVMKDGYVQQVAAPQELYEQPANLFVATFIGTPPMNTGEGTVIDDGKRTWLQFGDGAKVAFPDEKGRKPEVLAYAGQKVTFGVRPNDIRADEKSVAENPDTIIDVKVEMTELLGADTNLYLSSGDFQFTSVIATSANKCKMDDIIKVSFNTGKIHLFDNETEKTITK
ncbi:MAG: sn-glycerol-3-phosphate ABC transporter ATP-binding protein UgpC [Oscillospiraceae bacterium]|jgi:multiple sugar transport system ATP-binding protein|nr:sn-glycerol-3-phosphate ABC transporter ATP-binding protein UgpC [Oscillospiraceae bacterium]